MHYWRFEETQGTSAPADVGGYDGVYVGGYTLGQPSAFTNLGNAVRLDGQNGTHIALASPNHPGNSISVEAWVNLDSDSTNTFSPIIARWDGSYELDINNTSDGSLGQGRANMVVRNTANDPGFSASNTSVTRGGWHHIVGIFDTGTATIFVDGIQGTTTTIGGDLQDAGGDDGLWYIGRSRSPNSGFAWDGSLDEVAIYDYALSSQQIQSHINAASQSETIPEPSAILVPLLGLGAILRRKFKI